MTRRRLVPAALGAALAGQGQDATAPHILELRTIRLRNTIENQRTRLTEFLERAALPAFTRGGIGPVGFFNVALGPATPSVLALVSYPSLAAMEQQRAKLDADREYQKAVEAYNAGPSANYVRIESSLFRAFKGFPRIEVPGADAKRAPLVFEVRTYESNNTSTLRRKVEMFESGEIAIFRRLGMVPVFFGTAFVGANMPNLTYMLGFESLAAREKAWRAFGSDPEWQKMRVRPGLSDGEIVSNISSMMLAPLAFSPIR